MLLDVTLIVMILLTGVQEVDSYYGEGGRGGKITKLTKTSPFKARSASKGKNYNLRERSMAILLPNR